MTDKMLPLDVIVDPTEMFLNDYGVFLAVGCAVLAVVLVTVLILLIKKRPK